MEQKVFAGVKYDDGYPYPTAAGRYCEWFRTTVDNPDNYETFKSFFKTLELKCDQGEPGKLVWTVEKDTPDLVYYQVRIFILRKSRRRESIRLFNYSREHINYFSGVKLFIKGY